MKRLITPILLVVLIAAGCNNPTAKNKFASSLADAQELKSNCDPNYKECVPIAKDVDCANGNGDGPEYIKGPVHIIGTDKYKLDRDGDGIACDK
jgi:hypothetical protein